MSGLQNDISGALERLRLGTLRLSEDEYVTLLDAIDEVSLALQCAPSGGDPVAAGLWYNHQRSPALARLADALRPDRRARATEALSAQQDSDALAARALRQSLVESRRV